MNKKINNYQISGLMMILLGILFLIFQGEILSIIFTIFGVLLILFGIFNIINGLIIPGIIQIVVGVLVIVFGWALIKVCLYIVAILLIIYGGYALYDLIRHKTHGVKPLITILLYLSPVLDILLGVLLFINQIGAINYIFIFFGILLIIDGLTLILVPHKE